MNSGGEEDAGLRKLSRRGRMEMQGSSILLHTISSSIPCCNTYLQRNMYWGPLNIQRACAWGDGIYIPATDDEVMKAKDLIDHKSSLHYVLDNSQTAVCNSNDDTFGQEFMPIDCEDFSRVFKVPKVYSLYSSQFAAYADVVLLEPPVMEGLDLLLMETMVFGFA
ncbi:hypothetical protein L1987_26135 [Smallanthus sonchifolius]|uniref:Uncharacterized protein n=1 Tax=Smallanthus sonchifolius TaxID=185202 RepID=A0ACB9I947_9ASTR|nr:hypothetical protein L1987_26135 [Smallanthus sonchifolius]